MSFETRVAALATAIGADIKTLINLPRISRDYFSVIYFCQLNS